MLQGVETGRAFLLNPLLTLVFVLQIFEGVVNLLDKLKAWHSTPGSPGNTELKEMAQIGLRIITGYIKQQHSQVCCALHLSITEPVHQAHLCLTEHVSQNSNTCDLKLFWKGGYSIYQI